MRENSMEINKALVENLANQIKQKISQNPTIAIILGSGLADIADNLENKTIIPYYSLTNMPIPHVAGHKNQFVIGQKHGKTIIAMQGRFHPYDGFSAKECVLPIYIFKLLGVETIIITNSAGGVNPSFDAGDVMLIKNHINLTGMNPLIGGAIIDYGVEFVDLKDVYCKTYQNIVMQISKEYNLNVKQGVFLQDLGPSYETPAEVSFYRTIGTDAVSMSTVLEVIASGQCGLKVLAMSCIANKAISDETTETLTHEDVLKSAKQASNKLQTIIDEFLKRI